MVQVGSKRKARFDLGFRRQPLRSKLCNTVYLGSVGGAFAPWPTAARVQNGASGIRGEADRAQEGIDYVFGSECLYQGETTGLVATARNAPSPEDQHDRRHRGREADPHEDEHHGAALFLRGWGASEQVSLPDCRWACCT